MTTIRYRTFQYQPTAVANVPLADFDLYVEHLIEILNTHAKGSQLFEPETSKKLRTISRRLTAYLSAGESPPTWEVKKKDLLWNRIGELVVSGQFSSVHCLSCCQSFVFDECRVERPDAGDERIYSPERHFLCPHGHLLCRIGSYWT